MLKSLRRRETGEVEFCDRCMSVCDRRCRANAIRDEQWRQFAHYGWRVV